MPFFSVLMPQEFQDKFPNEMKNLRLNSRKLTTPFDVYETLKGFLNFKKPKSKNKKLLPLARGISLFDYIPANRTCDDANIEAHWCSCLSWINVNITEKANSTFIYNQKENYKIIIKSQISELKQTLNTTVVLVNRLKNYYKKYENIFQNYTKTALIIGFKAINFINSIIGNEFLQYCEILKLKSIEKLSKLDLNKRLLSFKKSKDLHGREAVFNDDNDNDDDEITNYEMKYFSTKTIRSAYNNLSHTIQNTDITYQIVLTTLPDNGTFELSLKYNKLKNIFKFNKNEISRINSYNNTSNCMVNRRPDLRQFCYCKNNTIIN
jgi:hypothetical protein